MNYTNISSWSQQSPEAVSIRFLALGFWLTVFVLSGCATTAPQIVYEQPIPEDFDVQDYDFLDVVVDSDADVSMAAYEKERLTQKLIEQVKQLETVKFNGFNVPDSGPKTLSLEVTITRYDKGQAFARLMLAGLGQIHIDGDIVLKEKETQRVIEKANVNKTFAWGGVYGASTNMEDVEDGFAAGVLQALKESREEAETKQTSRQDSDLM